MESLRRVHFVAIGGSGMGSLAGLLHARGLEVTGSDHALYPPMSDNLARWGIPVELGFCAERVTSDPPDLVVIGNAVRPDNPEARAAIEGKHSVVVSGTHGKTTTTSLVASLLHHCGRDPSLLVGGHAHDFGGSFREGQGEHFVVEGDEYDTAFFDKSPKFLHYGARTLLLTSVEFDHADIYRDLEHVKSAFRKLVSGMPADGLIVAAVDAENVRDVLRDAACPVRGYGAGGEGPAAWRAASLRPDPEGTRFDVHCEGERVAEARVPLHGRINVENALAALACACELGVPLDRAAAALERFGGVKRRQEIRGEARGVTVVDDFAHHPTAVRASIEALGARFPDRRLLAVFEPRTNTSRRAIFQEDYARAFDGADRVLVSVVPESPIYSNTGPVRDFFSAERLAADLGRRGIEARALDGVEALVDDLAESCQPGDVVLCMSNGDFGNIWERLLEALGTRPV